jgi:hypothetical protein
MQLLLAHGAPPNLPSASGLGPLHAVAGACYEEELSGAQVEVLVGLVQVMCR